MSPRVEGAVHGGYAIAAVAYRVGALGEPDHAFAARQDVVGARYVFSPENETRCDGVRPTPPGLSSPAATSIVNHRDDLFM